MEIDLHCQKGHEETGGSERNEPVRVYLSPQSSPVLSTISTTYAAKAEALADPVGGGLRGLQPPPLNFPQKMCDHPRDRCDRFSCYFIKQCVFVYME